MEQPRQTEFTADEFIAWALEQPEGRFELDNGVVIAMAPERVHHAVVKRNAMIALHNAIGARGLSCQALPDGVSVRVNDRTVYEPDALVRCGPPPPGEAVEVSDPVVVVEVVSPSSRPGREARGLLLVAERAALSDRRHRQAGRHPSPPG
jgi:Uma2 family endonuclease